MSPIRLLPIKVVVPLDGDFFRPDSRGGEKKVFGEVTEAVRRTLADQAQQVLEHFQDSFREFPNVPAVAKVSLKPQAVAKSHRPVRLLADDTLPVIGTQGLGELLVSVQPGRIEAFQERVRHDTTKHGVANISTIQRIEPYEADIEIRPSTTQNRAPAAEQRPLKVKLFSHRSRIADNAVTRAFRQLLLEFGVDELHEVRYGPGLRVFRVNADSTADIEPIRRFVGTQSVTQFPMFYPVRTTASTVRLVAPDDFPPPDPLLSYPVVGVIDSGVAPDDEFLAPWIIGRESYVPVSNQNNTHGSFVAGLIAHGRRLNHSDVRFPSCSARILDVVALGASGSSEDELLTILEDVLPKHKNIKVWNLSIGTDQPISDTEFSDFAVALDRLQDEFGVTFVLAAGNYITPPYRAWPPDALPDSDRICAPADSVRSIVVGSVAHRDHPQARVGTGNPSPFTRRGPGPLYLPRPELAHIGGNCSSSGTCSQIGVLSLDGKGNIAEDLGTSFATPLVSALCASVEHRINESPSRNLVRALLVHSAASRSENIETLMLQYQGFGVPPDIDEILGCQDWSATLVFELAIAQQRAFEKATFPLPDCLITDQNKLRANLLMTLVYDPPLDATYGSEYCRSNVEVSLGTYGLGSDGKRVHKKQVPEEPLDHSRTYEEELIKFGFKWSPVKVYRRNIKSGVAGDRWRLALNIHHRSEFQPIEHQTMALVVTIADPDRKAPVYNDMVVAMNRAGWVTTDLQLDNRIRLTN